MSAVLEWTNRTCNCCRKTEKTLNKKEFYSCRSCIVEFRGKANIPVKRCKECINFMPINMGSICEKCKKLAH
jgi:hypothetical protein